MKGDFSRLSDRPFERFSSVLRQQGRVDLDADWNEAQEIINRSRRTLGANVIGQSGTSRYSDESAPGEAYLIVPRLDAPLDPFIREGRYFIEGVECSNVPEPVSWQPAGIGSPALLLRTNLLDGWPIESGQVVRVFSSDSALAEFADASVTGVTETEAGFVVELSLPVPAAVEASPLRQVRRRPSLAHQIARPSGLVLNPPAGGSRIDLLYLDVWERGVTVAEDPTLREVALRGPDTTTRQQLVPQVRLLEDVPDPNSDPNEPGFPPPPTNARLSTRVAPGTASDDPCVIPPDGGYEGLENRLYRVQIFDGGEAYTLPRPETTVHSFTSTGDTLTIGQGGQSIVGGGFAISNSLESSPSSLSAGQSGEWRVGEILELFNANTPNDLGVLAQITSVTDEFTFDVQGVDTDGNPVSITPSDFSELRRVATYVWSRDNASVVFEVEPVDASGLGSNQIVVPAESLDPRIVAGDWLEIQTDNRELVDSPGILAQVVSPPDARRVVTLSDDVSALTGELFPRAIRWDGTTGRRPVVTGMFAALEDGVEARFDGSDFRSGDSWSFTARNATRSVEELTVVEPDAIIHRYAKLAYVRWTDDGQGNVSATYEDCRNVFDPLTMITGSGPSGDASLLWATPFVVSSNPNAPYSTVQSAFDAVSAAALGGLRRAIILLEPGNYVGSVVFGPQAPIEVLVSTLGGGARTAAGADPNSASISGTIAIGGAAISSASTITFAGLTLSNVTGTALEFGGGILVSLRGCTVRGTVLAAGGVLTADECSFLGGELESLISDGSQVSLRRTILSTTNASVSVVLCPSSALATVLELIDCRVSAGAGDGQSPPAIADETTDGQSRIYLAGSLDQRHVIDVGDRVAIGTTSAGSFGLASIEIQRATIRSASLSGTVSTNAAELSLTDASLVNSSGPVIDCLQGGTELTLLRSRLVGGADTSVDFDPRTLRSSLSPSTIVSADLSGREGRNGITFLPAEFTVRPIAPPPVPTRYVVSRSVETAFHTIQAAYDAVVADAAAVEAEGSVFPGAVILVEAGVYLEDLSLGPGALANPLNVSIRPMSTPDCSLPTFGNGLVRLSGNHFVTFVGRLELTDFSLEQGFFGLESAGDAHVSFKACRIADVQIQALPQAAGILSSLAFEDSHLTTSAGISTIEAFDTTIQFCNCLCESSSGNHMIRLVNGNLQAFDSSFTGTSSPQGAVSLLRLEGTPTVLLKGLFRGLDKTVANSGSPRTLIEHTGGQQLRVESATLSTSDASAIISDGVVSIVSSTVTAAPSQGSPSALIQHTGGQQLRVESTTLSSSDAAAILSDGAVTVVLSTLTENLVTGIVIEGPPAGNPPLSLDLVSSVLEGAVRVRDRVGIRESRVTGSPTLSAIELTAVNASVKAVNSFLTGGDGQSIATISGQSSGNHTFEYAYLSSSDADVTASPNAHFTITSLERTPFGI